jgi:uncharacterized membrane protein YfcA
MLLTILALGASVGFISSFFGVGGGVVIVPGLAAIFPDFPHAMIIACSLFTICINGIINSFYFYRSGLRPKLGVIALLGSFMVIGSLLGSQVAIGMDQAILKKIFAGMLVAVLLKTIFQKKKVQENKNVAFVLTPKTVVFLAIFGLLGGVTAGLTGVGGGIVIVPLLVSFFNVPYREVSSYSNPVMTMATLAASLYYFTEPLNTLVPLPTPYDSWQFGHINVLVVGTLVLISALFAPIGVKLTKRISQEKSKWAFAVLVLFMAVKMSIY